MLVTQFLRCWWVVVAAIVIASCPSGDARGADAPSCGELPCRANGVPYASAGGGVIIVPDEPLLVELTVEGDKIIGSIPRPGLLSLEVKNDGGNVVQVITSHPDAAKIPFAVSVHLLDGTRDQTLTWNHKFERRITFDAFAVAPVQKQLPLEICQDLRRGFAIWTGPFESIELRDFRFVDPAVCR